MREITQHAVRLLERAQTGDPAGALAAAETVLRAATGDLVDGPACMHFARVVAYIALADPRGAIAAVEPMLIAAVREGSGGWQACALASRAWQRLRLGELDATEHDLDGVLHDLVSAEMLAAGEADPVAAVNSRVAVAIGYYELRLYELVEPQFRSAYEMSAADGGSNGNRAMWLINLAEMHLRWALELYQIHRVAEAEAHTTEAERYAVQAADEVSGDDAAVWRDNALLYAACARADRHDPTGAAVDIELYTGFLRKRGFTPDALALSRPFHAVALKRSGHPEAALAVLAEAAEALPPDADWLISASTHRTRAVLMAHLGSTDADATLAYGDSLAAALWRQRLNTLHAARTMHDLAMLRMQHEQVARAADLDPLTGIANRRAFDRTIELAAAHPGPVAVLLVDTDKFKVINDTCGHAAGDEALRAIAGALSAQVEPGDLIARLGGDEFAAVLFGADPIVAAAVASRMVLAVREIPDCIATVSIGIALGSSADLSALVCRADEAMYRIKRHGGDSFHQADDPPHSQAA